MTDGVGHAPRLCVLASSSLGNCSALVVGEPGNERVLLLDAGLSPRRTRKMLQAVGAGSFPLAGIVFTHLDQDHCHPGWVEGLEPQTPVWVHRTHRGRAERCGLLCRRAEVFHGEFSPAPGVNVRSALLDHDDLGVAVMRLTFADGASLGYATDVGRPTEPMLTLLSGVDVLAIESNYCPKLQGESGRPKFLVSRIMGGQGHLSNEQSAWAVTRIGPGTHVVLLHLSLECNTPDRAAACHARSPAPVTISRHDGPTGWIGIRASRGAGPVVLPGRTRQLPLFAS